MSVQTLTPDPGQILIRQADVFFDVELDQQWARYEFGIIEEVSLKLVPVIRGRDSKGRSRTAGYDCLVEFSMMQTSNPAIAKIRQYASAGFEGNLIIKSGTQELSIYDVSPTYEFDINAHGGNSAIKVKADRYYTIAELAGLYTQFEQTD